MDFTKYEILLRIIFFAGGLALFWLLGMTWKLRSQNELNWKRWANNIGLTLLNSLLVRLLIPSGLVLFAIKVESQGWGAFHVLGLPGWLNVVLSFFLLDFVIYFQHVLFHKIPVLWRLHQVHHSDTGFDVTTALRFHPIEILLSIGIKAVVILWFGVNGTAVIVFEILLNFSAMFNHGNFSLGSLDRIFRMFVVTPDMHRIHHSVIVDETNSNYGFFLPWWDRIFKSYRENSRADLQKDAIGVEKFRSEKDQRLDQLLLQPFKNN